MEKIDVEDSCGNVFADLGLSNSEEKVAKADLCMQIRDLIKERGLNQNQAAQVLGLDQPRISILMNGKVTGFSLERLLSILSILHCNIEIIVKKSPAKGNITVAFA